MTFDARDLLGGGPVAAAVARLRAAVQPRREVGGWATVELDRAETSFGAAAGPGPWASDGPAGSGPAGFIAHPATRVARDDARDELLGAIARVILTTDQREVVLLEPFTEGRLAASLARHGEGFAALYLITDADAPARATEAGFVLSSIGPGPFGPQRLVVEGLRWGPFLVLAGLD